MTPDARRSPELPLVWLGCILVVYLSLAVAYNVSQPIGEAPDEPAHIEYIRFVQKYGHPPLSDPTAPAHLNPLAPSIEFDQMPLYYLAEALALRSIWLPPGTLLHRNPFVGWPNHPWRYAYLLHRTDEGWPYRGFSLFVHVGRLISAAFGLLTGLATYGLVRVLTRRSDPALFAAAWVAWNPSFLQTSSHVNNDAAIVAFGALTLFWCGRFLARGQASGWEMLALSLSLTAAILSKLHGIVFVPLAFVAVALAGVDAPLDWRALLKRQDLSRRVTAAVLVTALPLAALAGWWLEYGHTFATRLNVTVGIGVAQVGFGVNAINPEKVLEAISWLNDTFWSGIQAGIGNGWPTPVYAALAIPPLGLAIAGIDAMIRGSPRAFAGSPEVATTGTAGARLATALMTLTALPLLYATITRQVFPWVSLDANARFIQPVLPVIALLLVLGGRHCLPTRLRRPLAAGYLAAILTVSVAQVILLFPRIPAPTIPARLAQTPTEATHAAVASFSNGVDLLRVNALPTILLPGQRLSVKLVWRVRGSPSANFIVFTQLIDHASGKRVASAPDRIPFESTFPPILWARGEFVEQPEKLVIPRELPPGIYDLQVGLYQLRGQLIRPIRPNSPAEGDAIPIARSAVLPDASQEPHAQPVTIQFGDDLRLKAYTLEPVPTGVRVTLYWTVPYPLQKNLTVSVQLLDSSGRLVAQQDGEPVHGRLPTSVWPAGAIIRDDHAVPFAGSNTALHAIVVVYDAKTGKRLRTSRGGHTFDLGALGAPGSVTYDGLLPNPGRH